jgi:hypothetical protein
VIGVDESGVGKGSGRSIEGFNLVQALTRCADKIEKYGGHEMAAGLTIQEKNLDLFAKQFRLVARELLSDEDLRPRLQIDHEVNFSELNFDFMGWHEMLQPFVMEIRSHFSLRGKLNRWQRHALSAKGICSCVSGSAIIINARSFSAQQPIRFRNNPGTLLFESGQTNTKAKRVWKCEWRRSASPRRGFNGNFAAARRDRLDPAPENSGAPEAWHHNRRRLADAFPAAT